MTARNATAAFLDQASASKNEPIHLFSAHFDSGVVYATDAPFPISWEGNTYTALGHLLNFGGAEENNQLVETRVTVSLSGVDQQWIADVLSENYIDRRLVIRKAFLNHGSVVVDPVPIFDGLMDAPTIAEDGWEPGQVPSPGEAQCTVSLEAGSHWSDFGRRPGRHTNDNEQQLFFPGDKFFEFVSEVSGPIQWGALSAAEQRARLLATLASGSPRPESSTAQ